MANEEVECPVFPCYRKSCRSAFTQVSPCYHRTDTGVQTRVILCEACLWCYEMLWHPGRSKVRVMADVIPPWSAEGKRRLQGAGLWDSADPRCYESGIVPGARKRRSGTPRPPQPQ